MYRLRSGRSRIGRMKNPHPTQVTCHLILRCPATNSLRRMLFDCTISDPGPWQLAGFWRSMVFHHAPSLGRSWVTQQLRSSVSTKRWLLCRALVRRFTSISPAWWLACGRKVLVLSNFKINLNTTICSSCISRKRLL